MDGFYIGYKDKGISSSNFVLNLSKSLKTKAGHTGTLDLEAEGIMIIAMGQATKYAQFLNVLPKTYEAEGILGITTDTKDTSGNILSEEDSSHITCSDIEEVLELFKGEITQIPPIYSAKKIRGKKAYKLARKGQNVELKPIKVNIYSIELLECHIPKFYIKTLVSSGTYIRTLIEDIGNRLKVGATTSLIKRTAIGKFDTSYVGKIINIQDTLYFLRYLILEDNHVKSLKQGKILHLNIEDGVYKLLSNKGEFFGIVVSKDGLTKPLRMQI